jgi:Tfp pilus assembly protein PilX
MSYQKHHSRSYPQGIPASLLSPIDCRKATDRGVALIITLLLLFLMSVIGLAAVVTGSSDLMINGYYRNYRGSFYAADSGLNIARQSIYNYFNDPANLPSGSSFASPPVAQTWATNAQESVNDAFGSSYSLNNYGQADGSWAESFTVTATITPGSGTQPSVTKDSGNNITGYTYNYVYQLTSVGKSQGSEEATVFGQGNIAVNIAPGAGTTSNTVSFSAFGAFIDSFSACSAPLVPGYLTGPMYAKGSWNFGTNSPGYTFTDPVTQTDSQFSYWPSNGGCRQSSQPKYGSIVPTFQSGYNLNSASIPLPQNAFSQEWAVLDGKGCGENNGNVCGDTTSPPVNSPTAADLHAKLLSPSGTAYPTSGASSGVYLPYSCTGGTCTMNPDGGGILVEGDASVTLTSSGTSSQVFTVVQGSSHSQVTTTVTVNSTTNTTTVQQTSGHTTTTVSINGVPQDLLTGNPATMVYVDGDITSLSGPNSGAAIQDNSMVTVVANGDITVTGNITYNTVPVTTSANQVIDSSCCAGDPIDTLIPQYENMNQVLGIFTANGNFILSPTRSGSNIEVDGSIAMISQAGETNSNIGHMATGNSVGTFTNIGGRVENRAYSVNMNKSNVYFDRRFTARSNFAPPWFPSTSVAQDVIASTVAALPGANPPSRTTWLFKTGGQ